MELWEKPKYNFEREEKFEKDLYKLSLMLNEVKSNMQKFSVISLVSEMSLILKMH